MNNSCLHHVELVRAMEILSYRIMYTEVDFILNEHCSTAAVAVGTIQSLQFWALTTGYLYCTVVCGSN